MKIVHVLPALTKGGGERVAVELANASLAAGHEVALVLAYSVDPALLQNELDPRVEVRFVRPRRARLGAYASLVPWVLRHRGWLLSHDILHCHLTFGSAFAEAVQWVRGGRGRPKTVETYHAVGTPIPTWSHHLHRLLAARHDAFVTMASDARWEQFVADHLELMTAFIPNGIDLDVQPPSAKALAAFRRAAGLPARAAVMGTIGRMVIERLPDEHMAVFLRVAAIDPEVRFLVGGEGPERARLAEQARASGHGERFHFPGLIADPAIALAAIDLYLTLNVGEITGIAALEAAARSIPLIAVQADPRHKGGQGDWIQSSTDPDRLAAAATALLADPAQRAALGRRQRAIVEQRFSGERMASEYLALYQRLLDRA